jgi:nucleoside-diphosphate-sugar epimerase
MENNSISTWVLGSTGYVGRMLTHKLLTFKKEKSWTGQLITLGHRSIVPWIMEHTNFHLHHLDSIPEKLFEQHPPSHLYHCARIAGSSDRKRRTASKRGYEANHRLLKLLEAQYPVTRVVYCSGSLMYGDSIEYIDEDAPLAPISYAQSYEMAERPWIHANSAGPLDVRIARPGWILGPDSWFEHFFYRPALKRKSVHIYGDGKQYMSIISLEDCAGQLKHLMEQGAPQQKANLFGFEPITQAEFCQQVAHVMQVETHFVSEDELSTKYGRTVKEALTSNAPLRTKHLDWRNSYEPIHANLLELVAATVQQLREKR